MLSCLFPGKLCPIVFLIVNKSSVSSLDSLYCLFIISYVYSTTSMSRLIQLNNRLNFGQSVRSRAKSIEGKFTIDKARAAANLPD